jgi:hypothetical protein
MSSKILQAINLSTQPPIFDLDTTQRWGGKVLLTNESIFTIALKFGDGSSRVLHQQEKNWFVIPSGGQFINLVLQILTTATNSPTSSLTIEVFDIDDDIPGTYPVSLQRLTNVGNATLPTTTSNSVIVSGETAPNDLVKSTPNGWATPSVEIRDDGYVLISPKYGGVTTPILQIDPASSPNNNFFGTCNNVPATGVNPGTFNAGVILPVAQIGNGTLPAGISVPGASVTGTVANASTANTLGGIFIPSDNPTNHYSFIRTQQIGSSPRDMLFQIWDGSSPINALILGDNALSVTAKVQIDHLGNITAAGTTISTAFDPTNGNATFNCRGNFSGSASGVFNHGAGTTPNIVLLVDTTSGSSMTVGSTAYTSTQVTVTLGTAGHTFKGIAI